MLLFIPMLLWLIAGMAGTITAKYRAGVANVFTPLAAMLGPAWLLVALLLPKLNPAPCRGGARSRTS